MPKYNVHIYREMRLAYTNIEAGTPEMAAEIARDFAEHQEQPVAEDCDGATFAALVDVHGDEEFSQSRTVDFEAGRLQQAAQQMYIALKAISDDAYQHEADRDDDMALVPVEYIRMARAAVRLAERSDETVAPAEGRAA